MARIDLPQTQDGTDRSLLAGAIVLRGVGKIFHAEAGRGGTLKETLLTGMRGERRAELVALRDVDLTIAPGEAVGIVGANGSGKSTLLKIIAGITEPTTGTVEVRGRVLGVIELGAGFHPDLTGEENARLQAAIYGLTSSEFRSRLDRIFEYAELSDFRATALKFYSSGMVVRLGFAIVIECTPEILLVDEVLAVGDQRFQERCLATIGELRHAGTTIVLVTHHMEHAERSCDRIVWLKSGAIHREGPAPEVLEAYQREMLADEYGATEGIFSYERAKIGLPGRFGTGEVRMTAVRTVDRESRPRRNFRPGEPLSFEIEYVCRPEIEELDCQLVLDFEDGVNVAFWRAETDGALQHPREGRGRFRLTLPSPPLLPGRYTYSPTLTRPGGGEHYDFHLRLHHFSILSDGAEPAGVPLYVPMML